MYKNFYILLVIRQKHLQVTILLLLLLLNNTVLPQEGSPRIEYFTSDEGLLSQISVNNNLKDSLGFVWIASSEGLSRFDGKEFKHFWHYELDSTSISGNSHSTLEEDQNGNIWVATAGKGLDHYDYGLDIFRRVKLKYANDAQIVTDILVENNGTVWATTQTSGLHRLLPTNKGSFLQEVYLSDKKLSAISIDPDGKLWVGGRDGDIYKFDSSKNNPFPEEVAVQIEGIVRAFYYTDRHLLIGSNSGLFIYNLESKKIRPFELDLEDNRNDLDSEGNRGANNIFSFLREDDRKVWIGTGTGLYLFDFEELRTIKKIQDSKPYYKDLPNNLVNSLTRLSNQQILIGSVGKLNLIDFTEPYFKKISKFGPDQLKLSSNGVRSIFKDGSGLWIGTINGGLNLIQSEKTYYFNENPDNSQGLLGSEVTKIAKDYRNQRLWVSTTNGLNMINLKTFDPDHPRFTFFHHDANGAEFNYITDLAIDKGGIVWVATFGHGIFRFELNKDREVKINRYQREAGTANSLVNDFVKCIKIDKDNNIWAGTRGGLTKLRFPSNDYENPDFTNYKHIPSKKKSLSHNSISDILIDAKNNIWVSTGRGLNLFSGNNEFEYWTEPEQLPKGMVIASIQDDANGNLWLGCDNGIVKFDSKNGSFVRYGIEDGIESKEFFLGSKHRDKDGAIYLGGTGGITYFYPDDLEKIDQPRPLYFSELRVKDSIINPRDTPESVLKQSLLRTDRLEFKHNQFPFYLQFSSIDFRLEKNVEYGYKLLSTDKEWNRLTDPEIQFLNLPSGNHTLLVTGFSRGKVWEQAPLKMDLRILPPWWATWWAYTIYVLVAGMLALWFYRFQLSRKLAVLESRRLKEVNQLKNSLYTNITHEFRTPLTVILGMADSAKSEVEDKGLELSKKALEMIRRNGKNLLRLVNEMLDLAKLESGYLELQPVQADVVPFVKYICESFHSMAKASQIDLMVYPEIDELVMDFDADKLTTIISNLLSNAIKFTLPGGKIAVHLNKIHHREKDHFFIRVKDDGLGISEEAMPHIFNRFYQADATSSRKGEGTGIGLALTKEFVELMGGTITAKSTQGKGSEFNIHLPITKNAPKMADVRPPIESGLYGGTEIPISFEETLESDTRLPLLLIIEDNTDVAHYLKTCLQGKYEILHEADGITGIKTAYEKVPDIILSDVMMPGKDGYEVCATLKSDERTDHVPIIMLTAKVTQQDRIAGLSHGADAYLAKPFDKIELFTRLDQLILQRRKMVQKFERDGFDQFLKVRAEYPEAKFLRKTVQIIHEKMGDHSFGSKYLAHQLSMSESQIYRKLKAITGKSTAVFIRSVRLQKAKELIQTTNSNISEIAYDVGFNDPSWFSRAFKEEFGFSPSEISK